MKAMLLERPESLRVERLPLPPQPGPGEALVRVHRVGICGTDLHAFEGRQTFFTYPRVIGHELAVEVLALGDGAAAGLRVGDSCAVLPYYECGDCGPCRRGRPNCCARLSVLGVHADGGMVEQMLVPIRKLHRSDALPVDLLATVEPLCVGLHAWRRAAALSGDTVLVVGAGPIGLAVASAARSQGFDPVILELSERRLAFARDQAGHSRVVRAGDDNPAAVRDAFGGELPLVVFDCTGSPRSMNAAILLAAHGGTVTFVGHHPGEITFRNPDFHGREITLKASRNSTADEFRDMIQLLEQGRIDPRPWITHRVAIDDVPTALPTWLNPDAGAVKPVVEL